MEPIQFVYPTGAPRALTFSYDDGVIQDRQLVEIFNRYNLKATFHLNSGKLGQQHCVTKEEAAGLYKGHEIAAHTYNHPFPSQLPNEANLAQLLDDRRELEAIAGKPVRGFSYPFGDVGNNYPAMLPMAGIDYARTVTSHGSFELPDDFLFWHPTCHHNNNIDQLWDEFIKPIPWRRLLLLMYIWGHSYEFDNDDNWDLIENFCAKAAATENIWFATNGEIMDYIVAVRRLKWSMDGKFVNNPSALSVFILQREHWDDKGDIFEIKPGLNIL